MGRSARRRPWGRVEFSIDDTGFLGDDPNAKWLLYRLLSETVADLEALDELKKRFVAGAERPLIGRTRWASAAAEYGPDDLLIAGQQVMQSWETPLMAAMVDIAARTHGDVLEIGFGMGISAELFQSAGVRSHTVVELNDAVFERAEKWRAVHPDADIRLRHGCWQDHVELLGPFDAVFYDAYPISDEELAGLTQVPFPRELFRAAARLLRPGGVFTYYSNEIDSLSRWHQRSLLDHFASFSVSVVRGLRPPADCHYWWAPSMAVVAAYAR